MAVVQPPGIKQQEICLSVQWMESDDPPVAAIGMAGRQHTLSKGLAKYGCVHLQDTQAAVRVRLEEDGIDPGKAEIAL